MAEANPNGVPPIKEGLVEEVKVIDTNKAANILFGATVPEDQKTAETKLAETKAAETKAAEAKVAEDKAKAEADAKAKEAEAAKVKDGKTDETKKEEAPKEVEYTEFKLPEGFVADPEVTTEFKTAAKELKLTQEQAQKLVDMQTKLVTKQDKAIQDQWKATQDEWRSKSESDKEFGGKDFKANVGIAKTALDKFGTPELKAAINSTGMGNHPELIRFFYKVGKAISEDKVVPGNQRPAGHQGLAKTLFPSMN